MFDSDASWEEKSSVGRESRLVSALLKGLRLQRVKKELIRSEEDYSQRATLTLRALGEVVHDLPVLVEPYDGGKNQRALKPGAWLHTPETLPMFAAYIDRVEELEGQRFAMAVAHQDMPGGFLIIWDPSYLVPEQPRFQFDREGYSIATIGLQVFCDAVNTSLGWSSEG